MSRLTAQALMAPGGLLDAGSRLTQTLMEIPFQRAVHEQGVQAAAAKEETRKAELLKGQRIDFFRNSLNRNQKTIDSQLKQISSLDSAAFKARSAFSSGAGELTEIQKKAHSTFTTLLDKERPFLDSLKTAEERQKFTEEIRERARTQTAKLFRVPVESIDAGGFGGDVEGVGAGRAGITSDQFKATSRSLDPDRAKLLKAEFNRRAKLINEQRKLLELESSNLTGQQIARRFGLDPSRIFSENVGTGLVIDENAQQEAPAGAGPEQPAALGRPPIQPSIDQERLARDTNPINIRPPAQELAEVETIAQDVEKVEAISVGFFDDAFGVLSEAIDTFGEEQFPDVELATQNLQRAQAEVDEGPQHGERTTVRDKRIADLAVAKQQLQEAAKVDQAFLNATAGAAELIALNMGASPEQATAFAEQAGQGLLGATPQDFRAGADISGATRRPDTFTDRLGKDARAAFETKKSEDRREFMRNWLDEITRSAAIFTQQQAIQNAALDRERAGLT